MSRGLARRFLPLAAVALAAAAAPAAGDWLVTQDGARIETKGPWKVEGRRVVFTAPNGTLSAIAAAEVDLDRSAAETERVRLAAVAPPPPEPEKREPVLRLTEKDLPPVELAPEGEGTAPAAAPASPLEVVSWERSENPATDGVEIFGTLRNGGVNAVTSPTLLVTLHDEDGGLIATADATVNAGAIPVGRTANFRVAFPGVLDFAEARFDARGNVYATAPPDSGEEEEGLPVEEPLAPVGGEEPTDQELYGSEEEPPPSA